MLQAQEWDHAFLNSSGIPTAWPEADLSQSKTLHIPSHITEQWLD